MSVFAIYSSNDDLYDNKIVVLKRSVSIMAMIFPPLYFMMNNLFFLTCLSFVFMGFTYILIPFIFPEVLYQVICDFCISIYFLFVAVDLSEFYLRKSGFSLKDIIVANSKNEAIVLYHERLGNNYLYESNEHNKNYKKNDSISLI